MITHQFDATANTLLPSDFELNLQHQLQNFPCTPNVNDNQSQSVNQRDQQHPSSTQTSRSSRSSAKSSRVPEAEFGRRRRLLPDEVELLKNIFANVTQKPDAKLRYELSEKLQISSRSIQVWFQNRRAKVKTMNPTESVNSTANHKAVVKIQNNSPMNASSETPAVSPDQEALLVTPLDQTLFLDSASSVLNNSLPSSSFLQMLNHETNGSFSDPDNALCVRKHVGVCATNGISTANWTFSSPENTNSFGQLSEQLAHSVLAANSGSGPIRTSDSSLSLSRRYSMPTQPYNRPKQLKGDHSSQNHVKSLATPISLPRKAPQRRASSPVAPINLSVVDSYFNPYAMPTPPLSYVGSQASIMEKVSAQESIGARQNLTRTDSAPSRRNIIQLQRRVDPQRRYSVAGTGLHSQSTHNVQPSQAGSRMMGHFPHMLCSEPMQLPHAIARNQHVPSDQFSMHQNYPGQNLSNYSHLMAMQGSAQSLYGAPVRTGRFHQNGSTFDAQLQSISANPSNQFNMPLTLQMTQSPTMATLPYSLYPQVSISQTGTHSSFS